MILLYLRWNGFLVLHVSENTYKKYEIVIYLFIIVNYKMIKHCKLQYVICVENAFIFNFIAHI